MPELMDFFDAAREVAGTDRWIQYKGGMKMRFILVDVCTLELWSEANEKMGWPLGNMLKEKVWTVEPKPEELVEFAEAFAVAIKGNEIAPERTEKWSRYAALNYGAAVLIAPDGFKWWPSEEQIKGKWHIRRKPEEEKDNRWCYDPAETIAYMNQLEEPWIAFKILGAGAIKPETGFKYAFENGADFICVGMYDFQVVDDVNLCCNILAGDIPRQRPWRA